MFSFIFVTLPNDDDDDDDDARRLWINRQVKQKIQKEYKRINGENRRVIGWPLKRKKTPLCEKSIK